MTVLIAAAGDDGGAARAVLSDAGLDVERVATLAAASARVASARVAVVGDLEDASAREVRAAARSAPSGGPALVRLGEDDAFETRVPLPVEDEALVVAVRLAREAAAYRDEVDALYEQCRARANGGDRETADELERAKRRAWRALRDVRRVAGGTPYERLFGDEERASDRADGAAGSDPADEGAGSNRADEGAGSNRADEGTGMGDEEGDLDDGTSDDARDPGEPGGGDD